MSLRQLNRKDLFYVEFTKKFIPQEINEYYRDYVRNMPTQIDDPRILVESTLQSITVPSYQQEGVTQSHTDRMNKNSSETTWRSSKNAQDLSDKTLTLNFKLIDGYVNYWILLDTFFYHYDMKNSNPFVGDISLRILDNYGNVMMTRIYKDCVLLGISEFEISYSENIQTFETFNITIGYSKAETVFGNPGISIIGQI